MIYSTLKKVSLLMLLLFSLTTIQFYAQEVEPNNTLNEGSPMSLNGSSNGNVSSSDIQDYYQVILNGNGALSVSAEIPLGLTARVYVYNKSGSQLAAGGSVTGPGTSSATATCLAQDTVYLRILRSTGEGDYVISNSFSSPSLSADAEPNNIISEAQVFMDPNDQVTGHLGYFGVGISDSYDYFGLIAGDDGNVTITAQVDETLNARLYLYYKNGSQLGISPAGSGELTASASCVANDTIYALVFRNSGCGSYDMTFTIDTPPNHDQDVEPNNVIGSANVFLEPNESVQGRLGYVGVNIGDSYDYYGLIAGDDGNVTITAQVDETMNARLYLYYKNGSQLGISPAGSGELTASAGCVANDTIYALVFRNSGCGSYDMTFTIDTPPNHDQDVEPNNDIGSTNVFLEPNESVQGRLGYVGVNIGDSYDYYGLIPGDDGSINITALVDETLNARLYLYYKNGAQIATSVAGSGELMTSATCVANDTIYALVFRNSGCGSYDMTFSIDTPPIHDQDVEPNNVIASANVFLAPNESVQGRLGYVGVNISDSYDYFGLLPGNDGNITITALVDETLNARIYLYYKNGSQLAVSSAGSGELTASASCLANDTIYALVFRNSGCGSYDLTFTHDPPTYANDEEPNNNIGDALPMVIGENVEGHLGYNGVGISDQSDYYSFEVVQAPFELNAKITVSESLTARLYLYNSAGGQLAVSSLINDAGALEFSILTEGTHYLRVFQNGGCGSYKLGDLCSSYPTVDATPPGPLFKCPEVPIELNASAGLSAYAWYNGSDIVGNSQTYSATSSGEYTVIGYEINGCPDTSDVVIIEALNCDDDDPCTDDFCDVEGGCSNIYSGDDDSDGTCNNLDLCPNDPNKIEPGNCGCNEPEPGATCDDGDPITVGDTIQDDCTCMGTLEFDCPELSLNIGDACDDQNPDTNGDTVDENCDCVGVLIDSDGDGITDSQDNCPMNSNAYQADFDGDDLGDECDPDIDDDGVFNEDDCDPFNAFVFEGATCDDGNPETVGDAINADCVCEGQEEFDCPALQANVGDQCDDGDDLTANDAVTEDCICEGVSVFDCPELQANIGDECDDGDDDLFPGVVNDQCECEPGEDEFDCPALQANIGDECDDFDPATVDDVITELCQCMGTIESSVPNDDQDGAIQISMNNVWGVPGWDTFQVGCATLSMQPCSDGSPVADSWYKFEAQAENQGILARANPSDPNASNVDMVIEVFDSNMNPLSGLTEGSCAVSRTCFNNAGDGIIERAVPSGLEIGEMYFYRVYDANGGASSNCDLLIDTKVKTYATHTIVSGCENEGMNVEHMWTIEDPVNLYNIPPVPVFNVRMVLKDGNGEVVATAANQDPASPGGLTFDLSEFTPALPDGDYTVHAQNAVKMHANGCVSSYWSQLGPGCDLTISSGAVGQNFPGLTGVKSDVLMTVYPNPNMGDEVYVSLVNLADKSQTITLELFDVFGKKIQHEKIASNGNLLKFQMNLTSKLSPGLYMVHVKVGDDYLIERLLIE